MSKELSRKVIEAGLVPQQAVRLLKMWGCVDHDMPEAELQEQTQQQLLAFVEEIGELLELEGEIPEIKETDLDLLNLWEAAQPRQVKYDFSGQLLTVTLPSVRDRAGGFVFKRGHDQVGAVVRPGGQITSEGGKVFEIVQVEPRYIKDDAAFLVCQVQEVPSDAAVRIL